MDIDLAACPAGWSSATGVSAERIVVGQTAPLSGTLAAAFADLPNAFEAYLNQVNAEGGIGGRRIEVVRADDQYKATLTPGAAQELVNQGVFALAGGVGSEQALAASAALNSACVPQLFPFGAHPGLGNPAGQPWTVGLSLANITEAGLWARHIAQTHPAGAKVALIAIDNDYGAAFETSFQAAIAKTPSITLVGSSHHAIDGSDGPAHYSAAVDSGADVIIAATAAQGCTTIVGASGSAGQSGSRYLSSGCSATAVAATGKATGWLQFSPFRDATDPAVANDPAVVRYRAAMAAAGINPASLTAWGGFLMADTLVQTLRAANGMPGGLNRANALLAARSLNVTTPAVPDGVRVHLNGNADGFAIEGAALSRYEGTNRTPVTVVDQDGATTPCAWDLAAKRCAS